MIAENLTSFADAPVRDYDPEIGLEDPTGVAYRVRLDYDDFEAGTRLTDRLDRLAMDPRAPELSRLVIGAWNFDSSEDSTAIVRSLAERPANWTGLRHLFLGDIISEEQEISWIQQSDVTPLFGALGDLLELSIRGGSGLELGEVHHHRLEKLVIESGGLPADVVAAVVDADLPRLKHLELWLGDSSYGFDGASIDLLAPILAGERFPRLEFLGLKNCEEQDTLARLLADAPIVERLDVLDLSMGNLSDAGGEALAASPRIRGLARLDLHHHFLSDECVAKLRGLGIELDASDQRKPDEYKGELYRYVAVSE